MYKSQEKVMMEARHWNFRIPFDRRGATRRPTCRPVAIDAKRQARTDTLIHINNVKLTAAMLVSCVLVVCCRSWRVPFVVGGFGSIRGNVALRARIATTRYENPGIKVR